MNSLKKVALTLSAIAIAGSAYANEESQAFKACQAYQAKAKAAHVSTMPISCEYNSRSARQWQCLSTLQFDKKWSFTDAATKCFTPAPGLQKLIAYKKSANQVKPSVMCLKATNQFIKYHPNMKNQALMKSLCKHAERSAFQWYCMYVYASNKNSMSFSDGQCFPPARLN